MPSLIELIVGLGNPGPDYAGTRHNAGFWFIDRLCRSHGLTLREERKFLGYLTRLDLEGQACWLLKPMTYMNRSGQSVAAMMNFYRLAPDNLLVVHDELDLPAGEARLKVGGGHGGHNGLRDIMAHLGNGDFMRLRIGIGHPGTRELVTPYVLSRPDATSDEAIQKAIETAMVALPEILRGEFRQAMNRLHRKVSPNPP